MRTFLFSSFFLNLVLAGTAQDIYLMPYKKINAGTKEIALLSFSSNSTLLGIADAKGAVLIKRIEDETTTGQIFSNAPISLLDFIELDKKIISLNTRGEFSTYSVDAKLLHSKSVCNGVRFTAIDPSQHYLSVLCKDNHLEIIDLTANMTFGRVPDNDLLKDAMYLGYDRFGQQLAAINKTGDALTWNPLNQQFLRQLKLQSGEYGGSRSVLQCASTNSGGDLFVTGLQEVFIPKGGMQNRNQPERRNMIIAYDWQTGRETKRAALRFRPDGIAMGPGPGHVAYFSMESRTINLLNLEKSEVSSSVAVDERPTCITLSDDNQFLAVGTVAGNIYLYEVLRNNPAEVKITRPSLNRNYGEQVVHENTLTIEGEIVGIDKVSKVFVNGQPADYDFGKSFTAEVNLQKGKNRIKVAVQTTQSVITEKEFYLTCEPTSQVARHSPSSGKRMALVIGNASYTSVAPLYNTINDANSMASTLTALGFEVMKITNGGYEQIKNAIYTFGDRIQDADVSLFYYAGHGLEVDGTNYLVPVDATIQSALDVKQKAIPMSGVLRTMEFANDEGLNIIILDACRNNPFPTGKRSSGSGLARVQAPSGTLIAYATDPGSVASDGDKANGLYTGELVKQLSISQRIEDIFMNTRNQVEKLSNGNQRPWEEARLKGVFYLK